MNQLVIETQALTKSYDGTNAVDALNMAVPHGAVYGFLGRNGAGKTTTMRMLLGLTQPTSGAFSVFGKPFNRKKDLSQMGSLIEQPSYYGHLSGWANLEIVASIKGVPKTELSEILRVVHLTDASKKLARSYSLGMRQRLGLAMALVGQPKILILDEPTNGLDPAGIHEMRELICQLPRIFDTTVVVSSHLLSEIEQMATVVGIINQGKMVYQGTLSGLQDHGQVVFRVSDQGRAAAAIGRCANLQPQLLPDNEISVPPMPDAQIQELVRTLVVDEGVGVSRVELRQESLESIFLKITTDGIR